MKKSKKNYMKKYMKKYSLFCSFFSNLSASKDASKTAQSGIFSGLFTRAFSSDETGMFQFVTDRRMQICKDAFYALYAFYATLYVRLSVRRSVM